VTFGSTTVTLDGSFDETVEAVRAALAAEGFGVLTEIDVQATMKAKLGADLEPFTILGACNPPLALRALTADPSLALLLPCNVVVRRAGTTTVVEAVDPGMLVAGSQDPELHAVASEASARLFAALDTLGGASR
jgi:uncharacterized protein (DUF302 family)